jgi:hypothetical protein
LGILGAFTFAKFGSENICRINDAFACLTYLGLGIIPFHRHLIYSDFYVPLISHYLYRTKEAKACKGDQVCGGDKKSHISDVFANKLFLGHSICHKLSMLMLIPLERRSFFAKEHATIEI